MWNNHNKEPIIEEQKARLLISEDNRVVIDDYISKSQNIDPGV